ncbi:hypothetical protein FRC08_011989 [Ceratobasidium sp. 394]|nr:hypothetical protein FRC08_011989 [Ceratobasidium sp. 394]
MIIEAWINTPGSWHDVRVATLGVYDMLIDNTPDGYFVLTDSAFLTNDERLSPKIHTPLKRNTRFPGLSKEESLEHWDYSNAVVSARQAVEWGMRAIQGSFARLRMPLSATDKEGRGRLIETCLRLHNVRTSLVGINQIRTVYLPKWTGGQPDFFERLHTTLFPESCGRNPRVQAFQGGPQATVPGAA